MLAEDEVLEDEWRDAYEKRKAAWKREARQGEIDEMVPQVTVNSIREVDVVSEDVTHVNRLEAVDRGTSSHGNSDAYVRQVGEKWTLNKEQ